VNDWKSVVKIIREERDQAHLEIANGDEERNSLKSQLSKALDALTITQEEWLLKVQYLEKELYDARK
jgi:hypothetical protein